MPDEEIVDGPTLEEEEGSELGDAEIVVAADKDLTAIVADAGNAAVGEPDPFTHDEVTEPKAKEFLDGLDDFKEEVAKVETALKPKPIVELVEAGVADVAPYSVIDHLDADPVNTSPPELVSCKRCGGTSLDPEYVIDAGVRKSTLDPDIVAADHAVQMGVAGEGDWQNAEVKLRSLQHLRDCGNIEE